MLLARFEVFEAVPLLLARVGVFEEVHMLLTRPLTIIASVMIVTVASLRLGDFYLSGWFLFIDELFANFGVCLLCLFACPSVCCF